MFRRHDPEDPSTRPVELTEEEQRELRLSGFDNILEGFRQPAADLEMRINALPEHFRDKNQMQADMDALSELFDELRGLVEAQRDESSWSLADEAFEGTRRQSEERQEPFRPAAPEWTCSKGHENHEATRFCGECGEPKPTEWTCSQGHINLPGAQFCGQCGESRANAAEWTCSKGHTNAPNVKFCPACGEPKEKPRNEEEPAEQPKPAGHPRLDRVFGALTSRPFGKEDKGKE